MATIPGQSLILDRYAYRKIFLRFLLWNQSHLKLN